MELENFLKKLEEIAQKNDYRLDSALNIINSTYNQSRENEVVFSIICSYVIFQGILQKKFIFLRDIYNLLSEIDFLHKIEKSNSFKVHYIDCKEGKKYKSFINLNRYIDFLEELECGFSTMMSQNNT